MNNISMECLDGKTILEIGTGRGGTTRELVSLLSKFKDSHLITTDIADDHFNELRKEFKHSPVDISFIKTDACHLEGINDKSIDCLICNYTLCAINSNPGCETLALSRFKDVLKSGGHLYIEEEFPVNHINNPMQEVWSEKWRILKSCTSLLGGSTFNEMEPEVIKNILYILGFNSVECEIDSFKIPGKNCLDFFKLRLGRYLKKFNNKTYIKAIKEISADLEKKAAKTNGMEMPIYRIRAIK